MGFNKNRWQASNFDEKIGVADSFRRMGDTLFHRVKIGSEIRSTAGDLVITGVGFELSTLIICAIDNIQTNKNWSIGFDDGTTHMCIFQSRDGILNVVNTTYPVFIERAIGNNIKGRITAKGADGFTLGWALEGTCSARFVYICLP